MLRVESGLIIAKPPETKLHGFVSFLCTTRMLYALLPKNFLVTSPDSTTSTTPGFNCSMVGTWLARIPMSPEVAAKLTC